eukprot:gene11403-12590_t
METANPTILNQGEIQPLDVQDNAKETQNMSVDPGKDASPPVAVDQKLYRYIFGDSSDDEQEFYGFEEEELGVKEFRSVLSPRKLKLQEDYYLPLFLSHRKRKRCLSSDKLIAEKKAVDVSVTPDIIEHTSYHSSEDVGIHTTDVRSSQKEPEGLLEPSNPYARQYRSYRKSRSRSSAPCDQSGNDDNENEEKTSMTSEDFVQCQDDTDRDQISSGSTEQTFEWSSKSIPNSCSGSKKESDLKLKLIHKVNTRPRRSMPMPENKDFLYERDFSSSNKSGMLSEDEFIPDTKKKYNQLEQAQAKDSGPRRHKKRFKNAKVDDEGYPRALFDDVSSDDDFENDHAQSPSLTLSAASDDVYSLAHSQTEKTALHDGTKREKIFKLRKTSNKKETCKDNSSLLKYGTSSTEQGPTDGQEVEDNEKMKENENESRPAITTEQHLQEDNVERQYKVNHERPMSSDNEMVSKASVHDDSSVETEGLKNKIAVTSKGNHLRIRQMQHEKKVIPKPKSISLTDTWFSTTSAVPQRGKKHRSSKPSSTSGVSSLAKRRRLKNVTVSVEGSGDDENFASREFHDARGMEKRKHKRKSRVTDSIFQCCECGKLAESKSEETGVEREQKIKNNLSSICSECELKNQMDNHEARKSSTTGLDKSGVYGDGKLSLFFDATNNQGFKNIPTVVDNSSSIHTSMELLGCEGQATRRVVDEKGGAIPFDTQRHVERQQDRPSKRKSHNLFVDNPMASEGAVSRNKSTGHSVGLKKNNAAREVNNLGVSECENDDRMQKGEHISVQHQNTTSVNEAKEKRSGRSTVKHDVKANKNAKPGRSFIIGTAVDDSSKQITVMDKPVGSTKSGGLMQRSNNGNLARGFSEDSDASENSIERPDDVPKLISDDGSLEDRAHEGRKIKRKIYTVVRKIRRTEVNADGKKVTKIIKQVVKKVCPVIVDSDGNEIAFTKPDAVSEKHRHDKDGSFLVPSTSSVGAKKHQDAETSDAKTVAEDAKFKTSSGRCGTCRGCLRTDDCTLCAGCRRVKQDDNEDGGVSTCLKKRCLNVERSKRKQMSLLKEDSSEGFKLRSKVNDTLPVALRRDLKQVKYSGLEPTIKLPWTVALQEEENVHTSDDSGYFFCATTPMTISAKDICFQCGSGGYLKMLYCIDCGEAYHDFCTDIDPIDENNWLCGRCKKCNVCGLKDNLLICDNCHGCYHAECLGPTYHKNTEGIDELWVCGKCVKCTKCGSRKPGKRKESKWMRKFTMCEECERRLKRGQYCLVCEKVYSETDYETKMMYCTICKKWIHMECEGLNTDEYECLAELPDNIPYICKKCHPDDTWPPWYQEVREEINAGFEKIYYDYLSSNDYKIIRKHVAEWKMGILNEKLQHIFISIQQNKYKTVADFIADFEAYLEGVALTIADVLPGVIVADIQSTVQTQLKKLFPWTKTLTQNPNKSSKCNVGEEVGVSVAPYALPTISLDHAYHTNKKMDRDEEGNRSKVSLSNGVLENQQKPIGADALFKKSGEESHKGNLLDKLFCFETSLKNSEEINEKAHCTNIEIEKAVGDDAGEIIDDAQLEDSTRNATSMPQFDVGTAEVESSESSHSNLEKADLNKEPRKDDSNESETKQFNHFDDTSSQDDDSISVEATIRAAKHNDDRRCLLCSQYGDEPQNDAGRILSAGVNDWVHVNCALWSAEVYENESGLLQDVHAAIARGQKLRCSLCQQWGATVGCCAANCPSNYHFMCARADNVLFQDNKIVYCEKHKHKSKNQALLFDNGFAVLRPVQVDMSKVLGQKRFNMDRDPNSVVLYSGSITIHRLGRLSESSDGSHALVPVGFRATRIFWDAKDCRKRCKYYLSIDEKQKVTRAEKDKQESVDIDIGGSSICHDVEQKFELNRRAEGPRSLCDGHSSVQNKLVNVAEDAIHRVPPSVINTGDVGGKSNFANLASAKSTTNGQVSREHETKILPDNDTSSQSEEVKNMNPRISSTTHSKSEESNMLSSSVKEFSSVISRESTADNDTNVDASKTITPAFESNSRSNCDGLLVDSRFSDVEPSSFPPHASERPSLVQPHLKSEVYSRKPCIENQARCTRDATSADVLDQLQQYLARNPHTFNYVGNTTLHNLNQSLSSPGTAANGSFASPSSTKTPPASSAATGMKHHSSGSPIPCYTLNLPDELISVLAPHAEHLLRNQDQSTEKILTDLLSISQANNWIAVKTPADAVTSHSHEGMHSPTATISTQTDGCNHRLQRREATSQCHHTAGCRFSFHESATTEEQGKNTVLPGISDLANELAKNSPKCQLADQNNGLSSDYMQSNCGNSPKDNLLGAKENKSEGKKSKKWYQKKLQKLLAANRDPKRKSPLSVVIRSESGTRIHGDSIQGVWKKLMRMLNETRMDQKMSPMLFNEQDGYDFFGLSKFPVVFITEQLPGGHKCRNYQFQYHLPCLVDEDKELPVNPHGSARAEIYKRHSDVDMFSWLASPYRALPCSQDDLENESEINKSSSDLPLSMRFRQLKSNVKDHVGVYRSSIHGRGLFCKRKIEAGEMVIEYAGSVIRGTLTDKREHYYDGKGYGCYMFRIDDRNVVDATLFGNEARFINHSCEPNCYSRIVTVDGNKHIIIFASKRILPGEELTYDYKFPFEEEKLPCHCGSRKCRKYLN